MTWLADTLPALAVRDPGVNKRLPLGAFPFLRFSYAKDANRDGRIVDFGADILVSCFRQLIRGIFDAGEKLSFTCKAAVDMDGDERGREKPVERLAVFRLDGVVSGPFERYEAAGVVFRGRLCERKSRCDDYCQRQSLSYAYLSAGIHFAVISVAELATHCQPPSRLIQVSMNRSRCT